MTTPHHSLESLVPDSAQRTGTGRPKLAYIDCLRGYAVLMVIVCHTTYAFPELPYPVHRLGAFGWYGVQLFFLASCLTLMGSSAYERDHFGKMHGGHFFIRRFLRIAPMYYFAGLFYWFVASRSGANPAQALTAISFTNAWHPATMPSNGGWQLVPGGWSIGVEFTFYLIFPIFFAFITTLRRAVLVFLIAMAVAAALNSALIGPLTAKFGFLTADNFLYFWFFNQAPIFALGAIVFFVVQKVEHSEFVCRISNSSIAISCILLAVMALSPITMSHQLLLRPAVPQFLLAAAVFAAAIIAFSRAPNGVFVNRVIASVGKVSFSAYLLHFAVIEWLLDHNAVFFHLKATGIKAVIAFLIAVPVVVLLTYLASFLTYSFVELPMMRVASQLTRKALRPAAAAAS
jgi:peptidoglycan/LPS O-acetylase OafA/YrhL